MNENIPKIDPYLPGYILEWYKDSPIPEGWELYNDNDLIEGHEYYNYIYIQKKVTENDR